MPPTITFSGSGVTAIAAPRTFTARVASFSYASAVARTVSYALAMGKKPVVVNDCPGFLVNRILSPYIGAFMGLVRRGVDFTKIDRVMEGFGWPMGPAYLCDVVGIDTGVHAGAVMAEGFPDRMKYDFKTSHDVMFENERFGQKNAHPPHIIQPIGGQWIENFDPRTDLSGDNIGTAPAGLGLNKDDADLFFFRNLH